MCSLHDDITRFQCSDSALRTYLKGGPLPDALADPLSVRADFIDLMQPDECWVNLMPQSYSMDQDELIEFEEADQPRLLCAIFDKRACESGVVGLHRINAWGKALSNLTEWIDTSEDGALDWWTPPPPMLTTWEIDLMMAT